MFNLLSTLPIYSPPNEGAPGSDFTPETVETEVAVATTEVGKDGVTQSDDFAGLDFGDQAEDGSLSDGAVDTRTAPKTVQSPAGGPDASAPAAVSPTPASSAEPVATPAAEVPPTPAPAAAPEPAKVEPKPEEVAKPTAEKPPTAPESSAPEKTLIQEIDEKRSFMEEKLATERFALTPEQIQSLEAGESEVIPKLLAKVYTEATRTMLLSLENLVPQMVAQGIQAQKAQTSTEEQFYSSYQDLAPHKEKVMEIGKVLRALNPTMPSTELAPLIAQHTRAFLGLATPAAAPAKAPPAAPARPGNGAFAPAVSAVPAMPGAAKAAASGNEFDWGDL